MSESDEVTNGPRTGGGRRRVGAALGLIGVGLAAGAVLAGTLTANAAPGTSGAAPSASPSGSSASSAPGVPGSADQDRGGPAGNRDESTSQRLDEHLLSGDTATKVRNAALAKNPGATIQRVETDSDGVYEAHLVTSDGNRVTVEVGKDFAVTGEEQQHR